jgi:hypothetical protein
VLTLLVSGVFGQQSVLRSGTWFKFSVNKRGVYKIDFELLKKAGLDPGKINPKKIRIYGQGGGMLPQSNDAARPADLVENAIFVAGESDGSFNSGDHILFFAEGPDEVSFSTSRSTFAYKHNLYADVNFYYLTISDDDGKRIATQENIAGDFPVVRTFNDFFFHESDEHNEIHSGRMWFGDEFNLVTERRFQLDVSGVEPGSPMTWISHVMAHNESVSASSFKLFLNNTVIKEQQVLPSSADRYGVQGQIQIDTIVFAANSAGAPSQNTQEIKYQYTKPKSSSRGYIDFFLLSYIRKLALYGDHTIFRSDASVQQPISTFEISATPGISIWRVTEPQEPGLQSFTLAGTTARFSTLTTSLEEFVVFNSNVPAPAFIEKLDNQNLRGTVSQVDLLIITHADFEGEAARLAAHRQLYSSIAVAIIPVHKIYNEFSSGRQDVTAIRDFIRHVYLKDPAKLKNVLFIGRGSYDFKDRISANTNFVPTYESRNSLHPLATYSSDDYFGFMEDSEGEWQEEPIAVNHSLDIGVGRLPVKNPEELRHVIDKIIDYDANKSKAGRWRKEITFVADDGNGDDSFSTVHQYQSDALADYVESNHPGFDTRRIFIGTHQKEIRASGEMAPTVNDAILKAIARGTVLINYTGHGSERVLADERIFTDFTIADLSNKLYPFLVTATCEFGRQDDPLQISSAEGSLIKQNGGAIGLVTTARPVSSPTNFQLNSAFYEALFVKENDRYRDMGHVFRETKNNSTNGVSNRNFSFLGDPSMHLALPDNQIVVTGIETEENSSNLKALSRVTITGEIHNNDDALIPDYHGVLEATLFDKKTEFKTIGKNLFTYEEWFNALFRGKATVKDGAFQIAFIVPKNIAYELGQGKLSLYASDGNVNNDATGADLSFQVGQSEANVPPDNTSPLIEVFMGDTTFHNGGITNPDTYLVARLQDASGINISSYGIGNDLMGQLDDGEPFILNDYYQATQDNFTKGYIQYPMTGLTPGRHTILVKAWDTHNNPAEARIEFVVTDGKTLVLESFGNYPNPATSNTTFFFTHNRPGDDVEAQVEVLNATGRVLVTFGMTFPASTYRVEFPRMDVDKNLPPGLYFARVVVRSLTNASKTERVTKLIVLN